MMSKDTIFEVLIGGGVMSANVAAPKEALAQLFTEARTHNGWRDKEVPDALLREAVDLAKWGPTSANRSPQRIVFVGSQAAKARLAPALAPGNVEKTLAASTTAILAYDLASVQAAVCRWGPEPLWPPPPAGSLPQRRPGHYSTGQNHRPRSA